MKINIWSFGVLIAAVLLGGCTSTFPSVDRTTAGIFLEDFDADTRNGAIFLVSRSLTDEGVALLKLYEGEVLCPNSSDRTHCPYNDSSDYCTIGHGHLIAKAACEDLTEDLELMGFTNGISDERAEEILKADLAIAQMALERHTTAPGSEQEGATINGYQYDALTSFIYNVGTSNFSSSTLLKRIKDREDIKGNAEIEKQFKRWNKSNGQFVQGLLNRRIREVEHFFKNFGVPSEEESDQRSIDLKSAEIDDDSIDIRIGEVVE